ncbi:MAG: SNF2 helicase associated domain-containing protein, partial [Gloeobacteraceae cyanobacterium ES-bin-316]|nr:SNF2 helicase associated domain-containing protein [Ferruginibacter sp.]
GEKYPLVIQKNDERNFDTSCTCSEAMHPLCEHKTLLFLQLLNAFGPHYYDTIRNMDKEKNKLLQIYGYSLQDDLDGKFEFIYKEGKPFLKLLDTSIKRVAAPVPVSSYTQQTMTIAEEPATEVLTADGKIIRLGLVFNFNAKTYPGFTIDTLQGEADDEARKFVNKTEKLDLTKFVNTAVFNEADKQLFQQARKLQESEVNKYLNRNSPFSGIWENIIQTEGDDLPEETKALITEYLHPKLKKVFEEQATNPYSFILPLGKTFRTPNLVSAELSDDFISPVFKVIANNNHFEIVCMVKLQGDLIPFTQNECNSSLLFQYEGTIYLWKKPEDVLQAEKFIKEGNIQLSKSNWSEKLQKVILPLTKEYQVEFDKSLITEIKDTTPDVKLMLQEKGDYLLFQPIFNYGGYETRLTDKATISIPDGDKILVIHRNTEAEQAFVTKLDTLHTMFVTQSDSGSLALRGADVLRNNWFFLFVDAMKEMKIPVFGFEALKNFRFNTARPTTHIHVSSGLDWFDAKVEIEFGKERVGIADIKKALAGKQSFVQLGDGTLGILPDEWLKKYALLFKVGDGRSDKLRLSKYHMSVIDELYENRDETEMSFALDEKYERLKEFKNIPEVPAPAEVAHILRPYQLSGFQWLNYLNDVGWGGILADDMGL